MSERALIVLDVDGVLVDNHNPTPLGVVVHALGEEYDLCVVTGRCETSHVETNAQLSALGLAGWRLLMCPEDEQPVKWKVGVILDLAANHSVAAVFEDNPNILRVLAIHRIPIVPIYSRYYG